MTTQLQPAGDAGAPMTPWRDREHYMWLLGLIARTMLFLVLPVVWGLNQLG